MTSQPNRARGGNRPRLVATPGGFSIDAEATIEALWTRLDVQPAPALELLLSTGSGSVCYLDRSAPASTALGTGALSPNAQRLTDIDARAIAATASAAGAPTIAHLVWTDRDQGTFADRPRTLELIEVGTAWTATKVDPGARARYSRSSIDAGRYLVATVDASASAHAAVKAGRIATIPTTRHLAVVPEFACTWLAANCTRCQRSWIAVNGKLRFVPMRAESPGFIFDAAHGAELGTGSAPCPVAGCPGRAWIRYAPAPQS